jgi:hypothetical protein
VAINAEFQADFSQFSSGVQQATQDLGTLEGKSTTVDANLSILVTNAANALRNVTSDAISAGKTFIDSYAEQERATQRLVSALEAQGLASTDVKTKYADMATQFQNTTRQSDTAVTSAQALFTTIGKVGPENMEPAIKAAASLASTMDIDLQQAALQVAKAVGSSGEQLGKLGPLLKDVDVKGKPAAEILQAINDQLGPAHINDMKTYEGQTERLGNQMDEFKEQVGGLLVNALTPMMNAFAQMSPTMQTVVAGTITLGAALAPLAVSFTAFALSIGPLITLLGPAGLGLTLTGLLAFLGPAGLIVAGLAAVYVAFKHWDQITAIVQNVYNAIKMWLVDKFSALVSTILAPINAIVSGFKMLYDKVVGGSYVPDLIQGIGSCFSQLQNVMVAPTSLAVGQTLSEFERMSSTMQMLLTDAGGIARDAFGRIVAPSGTYMGLERSMGRQNPVNITINGSVLGNKDEIARVVGDAVTSSYRSGGNRLPV